MPRFARAIVGLILGYGVGVAVSLGLVSFLSGNTHDRSLESVMTAAFVGGPIGAFLGLVAGLVCNRTRPPGSARTSAKG